MLPLYCYLGNNRISVLVFFVLFFFLKNLNMLMLNWFPKPLPQKCKIIIASTIIIQGKTLLSINYCCSFINQLWLTAAAAAAARQSVRFTDLCLSACVFYAAHRSEKAQRCVKTGRGTCLHACAACSITRRHGRAVALSVETIVRRPRLSAVSSVALIPTPELLSQASVLLWIATSGFWSSGWEAVE